MTGWRLCRDGWRGWGWGRDLVFQIGKRNLVWVERRARRWSGFRCGRDFDFFIVNDYFVRVAGGCLKRCSLLFFIVNDDFVRVACRYRRDRDFFVDYLVRAAFNLLNDSRIHGNRIAVDDVGFETRVQVRGEPPVGLERSEQLVERRGPELPGHDIAPQEGLAVQELR